MTEKSGIRLRCLAFALALGMAVGMLPGFAQARQNVLIVFDEDKDFPGLAIINRSLRRFSGPNSG